MACKCGKDPLDQTCERVPERLSDRFERAAREQLGYGKTEEAVRLVHTVIALRASGL